MSPTHPARPGCPVRTCALLAVLLASAAASAQTTWRLVPEGGVVSFEVLRSVPATDFQIVDRLGTERTFTASPLQSVQILTARVPLGGRWTGVGEIVTAYSSYDAPRGTDAALLTPDQFAVGNPYIGIEARAGGGLSLTAGGRLPVSSVSGATNDGYTTSPERGDAFALEAGTVALGGRYERALGVGTRVRLSLAPQLLYSSRQLDDGSLDRIGLAVGYGLVVAGDLGPVEVGGGVVGREPVAVQVAQFGYSRATVFEVGAVVAAGPVHPGLTLRLPTRTGVFNAPDAVVGLSLDIPLR